MCGGGGNYGEVAQGIAGMFGSRPTTAGSAAPVATAPTPSGDTMSGIGSYMPMQQAVQSYAPTAGYTPGQQLPSESLYDPMAAAQARMATMPQTQARSVAELTPESTAAITAEPEMSEAEQMNRMYAAMGYTAMPVSSLRMAPGGSQYASGRPTFRGGLFNNQEMVYVSPYEAEQVRLARMP